MQGTKKGIDCSISLSANKSCPRSGEPGAYDFCIFGLTTVSSCVERRQMFYHTVGSLSMAGSLTVPSCILDGSNPEIGAKSRGQIRRRVQVYSRQAKTKQFRRVVVYSR